MITIRRLLPALLVLLGTLGVVDIASTATPEEVTTQCTKGNASACFKLGNTYYKGEGVTQDRFKAAEFFRQACDGQYAKGCNNLGVMYEHGKGVPQSREDALTFYGKACDLKSKIGCRLNAELKTGKK